ncbi:hypothetical protein [Sulfurimonas sp.]|uniref:hypothetical protein n=1 Tax=Sulfurimonas sp. TaxID=2022749 RepID=UPI002AB1EB78|nr:hypothetical protein [Sulfurimonas sp.]
MKKTLVSLAAASLIVTSAMAADKGIDIVTTGQAVVYYETGSDNGTDGKKLFDSSTDNGASTGNVGVQLNLDADLKNNFTFGSQLTYLGTMGLEKNLVNGVKQGGGVTTSSNDAQNQIALTKIFVAKKLGKTTAKIGRQELPKSLSPFAFSEGWNVFKNTFDAILVVNSDIPDTTLVGAYVAGGNRSTDINTLGNINANANTGTVGGNTTLAVQGTAYMVTVANKSIPMTAITLSYYNLAKVAALDLGNNGATALWADVKVAGKDLPLGLKFGLQAGQISGGKLSSVDVATTSAMGIKVGLKPMDSLSFCLAYTSVDGDDNKANHVLKNTGGIKTPLYTQMVYNQDAIALDANTFMVKGVYNTGDYGKIIAQYAATSAGKSNLMNNTAGNKETDYGEFDLIYKVKAGGIQYFAAWVNRAWSEKATVAKREYDSQNKIRVWARYNF